MEEVMNIHMIAAIVILGCFVFSGYFIWRFIRKYEKVEILIIPYLLAMAICLSIAFL
jgi:Kef-type K+ transport system membrane component KefB